MLLHAGETAHRFKIEPSGLDSALRAFARQSGAQLLYRPELTAHLHSRGLDGTYADTQALRLLLRGTALRADPVFRDTYVLRRQAPIRLPPAPLPAIPRDTLPTDLGPVQVNGLRLRRTQLEMAAPVTVIDRVRIEHSGYQTLYELLRAQPGVRVENAPVAMSDSEVYRNNGLSGATGAAAVNLHGLGASATLFLVDGQRLAGYGLAQGQYGTVADLNSIPLALVERIEILRDGASTIYGADAMAGVVNIVLRKRFDGVELSGKVGLSARGDAGQHRFTAAFGGQLGGGRMLVSFDDFVRSPLLGAERRWAVPSGNDRGDGYFYLDGSQIGYTGSSGCRRFRLDGACDDSADAATTLQTGLHSQSVLAHYDRPIGAVNAYMDLRWTHLRQRQQTAPATTELRITNLDTLQSRQILYSFDDLGPVRDRTESDIAAWSGGVRGSAGEWDWDARLDAQRNLDTDRVRGLPRSSVLDRALADGSYQPGSDGNDPALLALLAPPLHRRGEATRVGVSVRSDGPVAQLRHGPVRLTAGLDAYRERLNDHPDPLLLSNDVFQFQPPYVRRSDRWTRDLYAQLAIPLGADWNVQAGLRMDRVGGYGWATSPHLGAKWDITDAFSLRGTWARGYRAPTLPALGRPDGLADNGFLLQVPASLLPCRGNFDNGDGSALCVLRLDSGGNPRLRAETSQSFTLGAVLAPTPALGITVDVYQVQRNHEIAALPLAYAIDHAGDYPGFAVRDAYGVLYALRQQPVNLGHTHLRTVDLDVRYRLDTDTLGQFTFDLGIDWLARLRRQLLPGAAAVSFAGYAGQPRTTALAALEWRHLDWSSTANIRYTGAYDYKPYAGSPIDCGDAARTRHRCRTPDFALLDLNIGYDGWQHWSLDLNLRNVFDHRPRHYGNPALAYSPAFDDVVGRYVTLGFRYRH